MAQFNCPYPATPYLAGFLSAQKLPSGQAIQIEQVDLSLELFLCLFSKAGLAELKVHIEKKLVSVSQKNSQRTNVETIWTPSMEFFLSAYEDYSSVIEPIVQFLQNKNPSLAIRLANRQFVPEGPRFLPLDQYQDLKDLFGAMGTQDKAKYMASLMIDDLADIWREVDPDFELSRYGEKISAALVSFNPLIEKLKNPGPVGKIFWHYLGRRFPTGDYDLIGMTVPFPGNLLGALMLADYFKKLAPLVPIAMGGGYPNTELRHLQDGRLFKWIDYLCLDDGEKPLWSLIKRLSGEEINEGELVGLSYFNKNDGTITSYGAGQTPAKNLSFADHPGPSYIGLPLDSYVSMMEMPNPMVRLWSDYRWNKLILAHGCYWKKCTFCDVSLDYIARYEPGKSGLLVDQMEKLIGETGQSGFHFVDEAAPPALLKGLSKEIIKRQLKVSWWGNLRFDTAFTKELAEEMRDAGCIAVTGGLEVAGERLLKLINKGIKLDEVARVTRAFSEAGIYVHAYLMYGFPTQTVQETVDSLEFVRQLFFNECIQSGHWHRFACTAHSPVGMNPEKFSITLQPPKIPKLEQGGLFAWNEIPFHDPLNVDHDFLGQGLRKALYNYMLGIGLEEDVRFWFQNENGSSDRRASRSSQRGKTNFGKLIIPKTEVPANFVARALERSKSK